MTIRRGFGRALATVGLAGLTGLFMGCVDDSGAGAPVMAQDDAAVASAGGGDVETITSFEPTILASDWRVGAFWVYAPSYPTAEYADIILEVTTPTGSHYEAWAGRGADGSTIVCTDYTFTPGHYSVRARAMYWYYDTDYHFLHNSGWSSSISYVVPTRPGPRIKPEYSP